ncbi:MAG TPA: SIS domain-containing protein [Acidimicrobiales bacterium]|nr:SIS domain-containing protein [Acidimicrobiales bacterium]
MSGVESLYPFLYSPGAPADLLGEVARSTSDKAAEIAALRALVLERYEEALVDCARHMAAAFGAGGRLLVFGNGGSSTDAAAIAHLHLAPPAGRPVPALALAAETAVVTALANDVGFDVVFARQIAAAGRPFDVAMGVSTSGGSENVLQAFAQAHRLGMLTVGLAGYDGGRMAEPGAVDHLFVVPSASVHRIQEAQTTLYHRLWALTQEAF